MKILYVSRHFNHSGYIILEKLIENNIAIAAVLLHDDNDLFRKPFIRQLLLFFYKLKCFYYRCKPLKTIKSEMFLAKKNNIPILLTKSIKSDSFYEDLTKLNPDIIVLGGGWHELIPQRVYSYPKLGCINTHPSLLPEFRGTSITRWQVLHGVELSGSTIHYVDDKFDTGGVLSQKSTEVSPETTPQELFHQLGRVGAEIMIPLLRKFESEGKQNTYTVNHNSSYYKYFSRWKWNEEDLKINWNESFKNIHFKILSNTQESYEYLGPIMEFNENSYFIRQSKLIEVSNQYVEFINGLSDNVIYIIDVDYSGSIILGRKNEKVCLVLIKIQKFNKWHKYRRSYFPNKLLEVKPKSKFFKNE